MNLVRIAVLLTCYNRKLKTIMSLEALYKQEGLGIKFLLDIFLVDDNSKDGTSEAVENGFPEVKIIKGNGDLFWNRGMHLAWETASRNYNYNFYLWLNDDTTLLSTAIEEMLDSSNLLEKPCIICGAICSEYSKMFTYGGRTKKGVEIVPNSTIQSCFTMNGNCVLIDNAVFKKIGNLDQIFPHAIGDYDYGLRAIHAGFQVITTRSYIGYCERNKFLPKWCYSATPFWARINSLYSPLGSSHPYYYFIFEYRHFGLFRAIKHYISIHLRVLIPSLWK